MPRNPPTPQSQQFSTKYCKQKKKQKKKKMGKDDRRGKNSQLLPMLCPMHRCRSDYELNCPSAGYETPSPAQAKTKPNQTETHSNCKTLHNKKRNSEGKKKNIAQD